MAIKYSQGTFTPKNPGKVVGNPSPTFRSSWELACMHFFDTHPSIIQWASEFIKIPYKNPLTGKQSLYVPDFLIVYQDKAGNNIGELIEIKPKKETLMENAKSKRDKAFVIVNTAKWAAAFAWANKQGLKFRVVNEDSIFKQKGK
jgi:hypothetical protein